ncbi:hypothetical protein VIBNISOn1_1480015 [Vibrio nigripulchritudo SOn1]|uniref:Uncharacterized protein n=2 Tax=Vibrio nigripulchritudo TaxID=28173 RepID=A0AAV2VLM9_9VIBR|nr:hypothetical protein VIBNISOn1_1480015 [Vibrio nigripulchritudo SOn1]
MASGIKVGGSSKQFEAIERYETLVAGEYWRVVGESGNSNADIDDILLITNIDYVDNEVHTIWVRPHPSKIRSGTSALGFRVKDFLTTFEHIEQEVAKRERENRIADIQQRMNDAQSLLTQASSNPKLLDELVLRDVSNSTNEVNLPVVREPLPSGVIGAIKTQKVSALMTRGLTDTGVTQIKSAIQQQAELVSQRASWLQKKSSEIGQIAGEMTPYFEEQAAVALAETSEMRKHIEKLMEGIESLDLYTLKDVEVFSICEGESAPAEIQLTITQSVLYMDEELAVYFPVNDKFDCRDRHQFFEELPKHPDLIDQIFPTERCVVGMATTRHQHDYSTYHAITQIKLENENALVFFLVRDGENIYGVVSPNAMHQFTSRLFPSLDQMKRPFRGVGGDTITYDNIQYTSSLTEFEKMSLAYKRILILLCGLDHQKQLFGYFYQENASLEFVTQQFQEKYFNFIYDDDGTNMLSGKPVRPIKDWLIDMNTNITKGSRVLIKWRDCFSETSIPAAYERESIYHRREDTRNCLYTPSEPNDGYLECIVDMKAGERFVKLALSGENKQWEHRELNGYLSLDVAFQQINNPYSIVCLDRIEPDELKYYLHNRGARALNVSGINAIKRILALSEANLAEEMPTRHLLMVALEEGNIATGTCALKVISDAIAVFRCAYKGERLSLLCQDKNKYHQLLDQMFALAGESDGTDKVIALEQELGRKVVRIALAANGILVAYSTPLPSERDDRLIGFPWMVRTRYKSTRKGYKAQPSTFVQLHDKPANETIKYEIDDLTKHLFPKSHPWKTPKAKSADINNELTPITKLTSIEEARKDNIAFKELLDDYEAQVLSVSHKFVNDVDVFIPLAKVLAKNEVGTFGLLLSPIDALLHLCNSDVKRIEHARKAYVAAYQDKLKAGERFDRLSQEFSDSPLPELATPIVRSDKSSICEHEIWSLSESRGQLAKQPGKKYSMQALLDYNVDSYMILGGLGESLDEYFELAPPQDYRPCVIKECNGFRGSWDGYALYDLSDELMSVINRHHAQIAGSFDTHSQAVDFMRNQYVLQPQDDKKDLKKVFYTETDDFPPAWSPTQGSKSLEAIKAWKLEK